MRDLAERRIRDRNSGMKYAYFDAFSGVSGDMMLGALLDLGADLKLFQEKMAALKLPVKIDVQETKRASLRATKVDVKVLEHVPIPRKWKDIKILIQGSPFSDPVKKLSSEIFKKLFTAEARVHGHKFSETHLHEAGANDAIVDIIGTCMLVENLNIRKIYSSPLNLGKGWIKAAHGILPVPPPAAAEILKGIPVYSEQVDAELVTPTGAAIITTLAEGFTSFPELSYEKIGCGAGEKNFDNFPNILRVFYGNLEGFTPEKNVYQIEANIDDTNPQVLANFIDTALNQGALDVYLTPIVMKKNRMATKLSVLVETSKLDLLVAAVFKETSSIGVRYFPVERRVLEREIMKIKVLGEEIRVKIARFEGEDVNVQPEFADCQRLAEKTGRPIKKIIELVLKNIPERTKNHTQG